MKSINQTKKTIRLSIQDRYVRMSRKRFQLMKKYNDLFEVDYEYKTKDNDIVSVRNYYKIGGEKDRELIFDHKEIIKAPKELLEKIKKHEEKQKQNEKIGSSDKTGDEKGTNDSINEELIESDPKNE